jgi:glycosyltransferase involved in cell wall biosynthesis
LRAVYPKNQGTDIKTLTVLFNTWPAAFDCPGGGEVQLLGYEENLTALGLRVLRYDQWNPRPQFDAADLVHWFSMQGGCSRFLIHVRETRRLPLLISPIVWLDRPEKYDLAEIGRLLGMADHILPNSLAECAQLAGLFHLPPERFTPIVNGADEPFFEPVPPELFREHSGVRDPFVLCMGNLEKRKNQLRLIEALAGSGLHLVLAGQEREADYAAACRALAGATVHFTGRLEYGSALQRSAYAAAEILCLPSTLETPGLAALEAAAVGCRLALTREGCAREYFGDFAVYLDPYDSADIKRAIGEALSGPKNPALPGFVRERYTWKRAAQQLASVYRQFSAK